MSSLAIIVPSANRPHLLGPLVENIHDTTKTPHRVYLILETADQESLKAAQGLDAELVEGEWGCYVTSANAGVANSDEPYFIVANDDVQFHDGWDTTALEVMKSSEQIQVVGINQGNGRTDCFFLVDRAYVHEYGFYYGGYRSQFCDTEFCDRAKARGAWMSAPDALIEHLHWTLGKAEMDPNYERAVASVPDDQATYVRREAEWAAGSQ